MSPRQPAGIQKIRHVTLNIKFTAEECLNQIHKQPFSELCRHIVDCKHKKMWDDSNNQSYQKNVES